MTDYSDITLKLENNRTAYIPSELQVLRLAPACLAQLYKRILDSRALLEQLLAEDKISIQAARRFDPIVKQLPLEERILSGKIIEIHNAILEMCLTEKENIDKLEK